MNIFIRSDATTILIFLKWSSMDFSAFTPLKDTIWIRDIEFVYNTFSSLLSYGKLNNQFSYSVVMY